MEYTPSRRLERLWELAQADPDCAACLAEMQEARERLARYTDALPEAERTQLWACPVTTHTCFSRLLDLAARHMRFPEESDDTDL